MNWLNILFPALSIGGLGLVFGLGLGVASKKFAVEVNPLIPAVRDVLPGANCGGCGFPGCDGFAKAVVNKEAPVNGCPVGGNECAASIGEILGEEVSQEAPTVAYIKCSGTCGVAHEKYKYIGLKDCESASLMTGSGSKACSHGCLGLGSCVNVCAFDALHVVDGVAVVDEDNCVSCGKCVDVCPKELIQVVPKHKRVRVACNSHDKGKQVKMACGTGCISCRICVKTCEFDAISIVDNVAVIDYNLCTECGKCIEKCPVNAIELI